MKAKSSSVNRITKAVAPANASAYCHDLDNWPRSWMGLEKDLPPVKLGYRASLRLPIRSRGELIGGINFMSFTPALYTPAGQGFARVTVVDAQGRSDSSRIRFVSH